MILIVAAAIVGAASGLFVQPRLFAIAVALSLSGAAHLVLTFLRHLMAHRAGEELLLRRLDMIAPADVHGIWPVMAAAGAGALLAAVLWSLFQRQSTDRFWFGRGWDDNARAPRLMGQVEARAEHDAARKRLNDLLDR
ncbi:MAG: hypothetical protein Q8L66_04495 [Caulobacter sp.]|nr:hypothetical protein [Caulobacter sp.]